MSLHQHHTAEDIEVLREMIRLAENRREEEMQMLEKMNQYNLALVGFAGGFLSLLVTAPFPDYTVRIAGAFLMLSILLSLLSIRPRRVGAALVIEDDIQLIKTKHATNLYEYLLQTAELTDQTASNLNTLLMRKKNVTIFSAIFLAIALLVTYTMYAYA